MGYAFCYGPCIVCGVGFSYNPVKVPSTSAITGVREPICRSCIERANASPERRKRGLPPLTYAPDAYEPCDEAELGE